MTTDEGIVRPKDGTIATHRVKVKTFSPYKPPIPILPISKAKTTRPIKRKDQLTQSTYLIDSEDEPEPEEVETKLSSFVAVH